MSSNPQTLRQVLQIAGNAVLDSQPGPILAKAGRATAQVINIVAAVVFGVLTGTFLISLWELMIAHRNVQWLPTDLQPWKYALLIICYLAIAIPAVLIKRVADRAAEQRSQSHSSEIVETTLAIAWGLAGSGVIVVALFHLHAIFR